MRKTYLINLISGPGSGKSCMAALLFAQLKIRGYVVEFVQEYAKSLVWTKDFETLNNQYYVTQKQYRLFKEMLGHVDFIVTDSSLLNCLYYNRHNQHNTSNIDKTEKLIFDCYNEFNNINIFLERGDYKYEQQGRIETEEESRQIDMILQHLIGKHNIQYKKFHSNVNNVESIAEYIITCTSQD